jgi:outer membrane lipoprotein-sorting protein
MTRGVAALVLLAMLIGRATAAPEAAASNAPPATLVSGDPARGTALDPVFAHFKLEKLSCTFSEEKRVALLARPLRSSGTIYFDHGKGVARITQKPKLQQVVVTTTTLRIRTDKRTEEIPLSKSKDLQAFASIVPSLLRGDRAELERAFEIGLYGSDKDWWALTFTPKTESLKKLVAKVTVFGRKSELVSLQVAETNGDTTTTKLANVRKNDDVPATEIATAFGAK